MKLNQHWKQQILETLVVVGQDGVGAATPLIDPRRVLLADDDIIRTEETNSAIH